MNGSYEFAFLLGELKQRVLMKNEVVGEPPLEKALSFL